MPARKNQEAMLHQIDGLCGFLVGLAGTHLSNYLSAFNHASLHISSLELDCIALNQNGIYSYAIKYILIETVPKRDAK